MNNEAADTKIHQIPYTLLFTYTRVRARANTHTHTHTHTLLTQNDRLNTNHDMPFLKIFINNKSYILTHIRRINAEKI